MITFKTYGKFKKTNSFLQRMLEIPNMSWLDKYGKKGVNALKEASPKDTGLMADSWYYKIERDKNGNVSLLFNNSDIENGMNVAILIQYGHGTKNGSYIEGIDYINPALRPIVEEIASQIEKEVNKR